MASARSAMAMSAIFWHLTSSSPIFKLVCVTCHGIDDQLDNEWSLVSEVWRAFLVLMGIALVAEALLCLPPKAEEEAGVA
ncbi:MAG: hypothetical protein AAF456_20070 [Planctomycetota bacterium]